MVILQNKFPCRNEKECIWRVIDNETVIFAEDGQWLHQLNGIGHEIWNMCDGTVSIEEITNKICDEFEVENSTALNDVLSFIKELSHKNLITYK